MMDSLTCTLQPLFSNYFVSDKRHNFSTRISLKQVQIPSLNASGTSRVRMAQNPQNPVIPQQKIVIPNKHGEKLVGLLHDTQSPEIVILCHGFGSNKEHITMKNLATALEKEGISAFRFDFAGNGESEGTFQYGNFWREVDDLLAVIEHFKSANRVTSAILGHSKGGVVVLLYASKYDNVSVVVNVSGRYNLKRGITERLGEDYMEKLNRDGFLEVKNRSGSSTFRVTKESMMERLNTNMHEACLQIDKSCRVLTVHGTADEITPVEEATEFSKTIPNHKLHIIEGANHVYADHQTELASVVVSFIKGSLAGERK